MIVAVDGGMSGVVGGECVRRERERARARERERERRERGLSFDGRMTVVRSCIRKLEVLEVASFGSGEESGGESGSVCVYVYVCVKEREGCCLMVG